MIIRDNRTGALFEATVVRYKLGSVGEELAQPGEVGIGMLLVKPRQGPAQRFHADLEHEIVSATHFEVQEPLYRENEALARKFRDRIRAELDMQFVVPVANTPNQDGRAQRLAWLNAEQRDANLMDAMRPR